MKNIILISGKQGSGKSTLSSGLFCTLSGVGVRVAVLKYASPLYEMQEAIRRVATKYEIPFDKKEGRLLQWLGTEWGREIKGYDTWVNAAKVSAWQSDRDWIVFDDCRFENEFDAFPDAYTIRLACSRDLRKYRAEGWRDSEDHPSETGLDSYEAAGKFHLYLSTGSMPAEKVIEYSTQKIKKHFGVK